MENKKNIKSMFVDPEYECTTSPHQESTQLNETSVAASNHQSTQQQSTQQQSTQEPQQSNTGLNMQSILPMLMGGGGNNSEMISNLLKSQSGGNTNALSSILPMLMGGGNSSGLGGLASMFGGGAKAQSANNKPNTKIDLSNYTKIDK